MINEENLAQLVELLKATQTPDNAVQNEVNEVS